MELPLAIRTVAPALAVTTTDCSITWLAPSMKSTVIESTGGRMTREPAEYPSRRARTVTSLPLYSGTINRYRPSGPVSAPNCVPAIDR
jgi:hypothetical protein